MSPAAEQPGPIRISTPLAEVRALRPAWVDALARLGVVTVADLIKHLPMRYERLEAEAPIRDLAAGSIVTARGEISATRVRPGRRPRFEAALLDHTGRLDLVWFNQTYLKDRIFPGMRLRVQGQAKRFGPHGAWLQLVNPKWEALDEDTEVAEQESRTRPVYPASEHINSAKIELAVARVLDAALPQIEDHLSDDLRRVKDLPGLAEAYRMAHRPASEEEAAAAHRRLAYDELLLLQLGVFLRRAQVRRTMRAEPLRWSEQIDRHIRARFPFALTGAQDRVIGEVVADLMRDEPANRLIQGDVGSGKTVIALYAMLLAAASGHQAALMAPTELLAEQHFLSISEVLKGSNVRMELLTGALGRSERDAALARIAAGDADLVIGTHALLTGDVKFRSLAVVVIDEQHRFGVHQRATLRGKAAEAAGDSRTLVPHTLVMTATPIPRTLALTLLGDLDVSTIDQLPPGRMPIATRVVASEKSAEVYRFVRQRLDAGDQAYIVVPAIDTGASAAGAGGDEDLADLRSVMARLEAHELAGKRLAAMHGRLASRTRDHVMHRFRAGLIDALIATTVIEVGVDVPNATVMVIEHADMFGLAQLHQLRGRVGRGQKRSVCVLIADPKTPDAEQRLAAMAATTDGFALAERDLEIRGPGEVFGQKQAGAPPFKVADLMRDRELLVMARRDAAAWIERSPELNAPGEDLLRKRLLKLHGKWLGLGDVG
ncbi:MAG: ATP-dependent DNA helicase RecG [Phycisphaeraceae bacterium]|nr:ATP-dependent DNA helicase RecG [Phycisphaeraceae bacterium]